MPSTGSNGFLLVDGLLNCKKWNWFWKNLVNASCLKIKLCVEGVIVQAMRALVQWKGPIIGPLCTIIDLYLTDLQSSKYIFNSNFEEFPSKIRTYSESEKNLKKISLRTKVRRTPTRTKLQTSSWIFMSLLLLKKNIWVQNRTFLNRVVGIFSIFMVSKRVPFADGFHDVKKCLAHLKEN